MCAAIGLIWKYQVHSIRPFLMFTFVGVLKFAKIVIIDNGDVANAFIDRFYLCSVVALWPTCQIVEYALRPIFCFCFTRSVDERCYEGSIVNVAAGARADPALPL